MKSDIKYQLSNHKYTNTLTHCKLTSFYELFGWCTVSSCTILALFMSHIATVYYSIREDSTSVCMYTVCSTFAFVAL